MNHGQKKSLDSITKQPVIRTVTDDKQKKYLKRFLSGVHKLVPSKLGTFYKGLAAFSADVNTRSVCV